MHVTETDPTDETLARRVQEGDQQAFGALMTRYEAKLKRYGTKFLANTEDITDIVQEVFISTYQNIKSFDMARSFSPWIYRVAHNAFANELRRRSRAPLIFIDFDTFIPHEASDLKADDHAERESMRRMIEKGLEEVRPAYREVLILYYLDELSYQEIADVLRVPVGTVGVRIKRAREALRKVYEELNMHYEH